MHLNHTEEIISSKILTYILLCLYGILFYFFNKEFTEEYLCAYMEENEH